jgi:SAM-dependent methyltransferase
MQKVTQRVEASTPSKHEELQALLKDSVAVEWKDGVAIVSFKNCSAGLNANREYFDNLSWASSYLKYVHRSEQFHRRWETATGSWSGKVVVDIGCGPGNIQATLREDPALLIGVDVSFGALGMAADIGYLPLLADAHDLPLISGCADIVIANATLHHCDDMAVVLAEAARLVKPGGLLVTDHDLQLSGSNFKGLGLWVWKSRLSLYRLLKKGFHRTLNEQRVVLTSEIHHVPGDGVTKEFFVSTLEPLGFLVDVYPHNHDLGAEVLDGRWGRSSYKFRIAQLLSGMNPNSSTSALSLMCRAVREHSGPAETDA